MTTMKINDSLTSFTQRIPSAWGGRQDHDRNNIQKWREFYMNHQLARTAIDRIPEDCFRKGYQWGGATPEQINALQDTERRLRVKEMKKKALTFARLDGEAYIYMDNGEAPDQPLDVSNMKRDGLRFINMLRYTDIIKGPWDMDPLSPYFHQPMWYSIVGDASGTVIHPSRMSKFIRNPDPNTGIGISDLYMIHDTIEWLEKAECNTSELTTEARIDVMSVTGLMDAVQDPEMEAAIVNRYRLAAELKRTNNMLVIDKEGEEYAQKTTTFTGLTDVIESFRRGFCAATEIPYALVFGRHGGLGANAETDMKMYYDNIHTLQRNEITDACYSLNEAIIRSSLGTRPPELFIDWLPLHEVTEAERVENAFKMAQTVKTLVESQAIPADILTEPTVNWLIEMNAFPGIEQANEEWKAGGGTLEPDDAEEADLLGRGAVEEDITVTDTASIETEEQSRVWGLVSAILKRKSNS